MVRASLVSVSHLTVDERLWVSRCTRPWFRRDLVNVIQAQDNGFELSTRFQICLVRRHEGDDDIETPYLLHRTDFSGVLLYT